MSVRFTLPDVGEGLDRAEVVDLLVAEGDTVGRDQPLLLILTDKAEVELPSPVAGTVTRLAVAPGDMVEVGALLVEIDDATGSGVGVAAPAQLRTDSAPDADGPSGEAAAAPRAHAPEDDAPTAGARAAASGASAAAPHAPARDAGTAGATVTVLRPKASPSTRRLAAELGVDLGSVPGSGPGGRVTAEDVRAHDEPGAAAPAAAEPAATPVAEPVDEPATASVAAATAPLRAGPRPSAALDHGTHPLRGIRRATAEAMTRSWSEIPHITGMDEIDATELLAVRDRLRASAPEGAPPISALALMIMAVARALRAHSMTNAGVEPGGESVTVHEACNVGMATATPQGLLVPVIRDADRLGVTALAGEIARLAGAARSGALTPADLRGGTSTVTNYGSLGDAHYATPLIRPGESTIVGFGSIRPRPWVMGDEIVVRPVLPVVVSADHRIIDGDLLNAFSNQIKADLDDPVRMLL